MQDGIAFWPPRFSKGCFLACAVSVPVAKIRAMVPDAALGDAEVLQAQPDTTYLIPLEL